MRLKGVALVTGLLLVLAVGGVWLQKGMRPSRAPGRVGQTLLAGVELSQVKGVVISKGDETVTLKETPAGWAVVEQQDFPAKEEKILKFLLRLGEAEIGHKVTENPERLASLGLLEVSENGGKYENRKTAASLTLSGEDGKPFLRVLLGNDRSVVDPRPGAAGGGQFIRYPDSKAAYLIPEAFFLDTESNRWLDDKVFPFDEEKDLKSMRLSRVKAKALAFSRPDEKGKWSLAGTAADGLDQAEVGSLAGRLGRLTLTGVGKPGMSAKSLGREKLADYELELFDGRRFTMTMGEKKVGEEDVHYIALSATLSPEAKDKTLQEGIDDFNARVKGRFLAVFDWEARNLLKVRKDFLAKKK
ncbi:MAG: DUF4340 domain-containing protein [bacterium]